MHSIKYSIMQVKQRRVDEFGGGGGGDGGGEEVESRWRCGLAALGLVFGFGVWVSSGRSTWCAFLL